MFQRILVPLDGSRRAEHAIPMAIRLARASGGSIVFVHSVFPPSGIGNYGAEENSIAVPPNAYEKRLAESEQYLHTISRLYAEDLKGLAMEQEVDTGAAASTIFSTARLEHIDLIVMCSHGAHPLFHWIFRSVARQAVHSSPVPVLVLKENTRQFPQSHEARPLRMLVPLDGSELAEAVLEPACQLLLALVPSGQAEIHLLQVVDLPSIEGKSLLRAYELKSEQAQAIHLAGEYLKETAQRLTATIPTSAHVDVTWSITVSNHVARTIADTITTPEGLEPENEYDLLAIATHGRTGLHLLRLGSVTEHILGATDLPLLIVRPPQAVHRSVQKIEAGTNGKRGG